MKRINSLSRWFWATSRGAPLSFLGLQLLVLGNVTLWLIAYILVAPALFDTAGIASPHRHEWLLLITHMAALCGGLSCLALLISGLSWATRTHRLGLLAVITLVTLTTLYFLVDTLVYLQLGIHLDSSFVTTIVGNPAILREANLGASTLVLAIGILALIVACQGALTVATSRLSVRISQPRKRLVLSLGLGVLALLTLEEGVRNSSYYAKQTMAAGVAAVDAVPFYSLTHERFAAPVFDHRNICYPNDGIHCPKSGETALAIPVPALKRRPDILYVLAESLRADFVGGALTPNISRFSQEHGCMTSARHYSGGHETNMGVFSFLYGVHAYHYNAFSDAGEQSWPLAVLKANGYKLSAGMTSQLVNWRNADFLFRQFDEVKQIDGPDRVQNERDLVKWIHAARKDKEADQPQFYFAFFNATHNDYYYPPELERHTPVYPAEIFNLRVIRHMSEGRELVVNRYRNAVGYIDALLRLPLGIWWWCLAATMVKSSGTKACLVMLRPGLMSHAPACPSTSALPESPKPR